ncbi:ATP-binding protein [Methanococcoides seepicolus]|uniref:ATP-binding protein n=1 Tax=Methanococcoides seepicolus TaxID=2828780 RepID=A0A9E4ZG63_9EURY|nr:ATP-binding protein [Methanococcoides seepicolus]MCM1987300.1 ATP-binding protein [Methanococcoides seepicolus]
MKISIASGKGGTGKTTVAVNLALSLKDAQLFDCDVEEPNCNLFLGYDLEKVEEVNVLNPVIDKDKCDFCGKCSEFCQFNALAVLPEDVMIFPTLCHGCGGCSIVCPNEAISEVGRTVGVIEGSVNEDLVFYQGMLKIGELMTSLVIKALQDHIDTNRTAIIDAPPGTACPFIASVKNVDYCILVTESTPFGFHDLKLAVDVIRTLGIQFGVVVNLCDIGDNSVEKYCIEEEIPVLMKIPYDRDIARLYSQGIPFVNEMPEWKERFVKLFRDVTSLYEMGNCSEQ